MNSVDYGFDGGPWGRDLPTKIRLPLPTLRRAGKTFTFPIRVPFKSTVVEPAAGTTDTFNFLLTGMVTLTRAYTCYPNGCRGPV
jgi:hypothetical protein